MINRADTRAFAVGFAVSAVLAAVVLFMFGGGPGRTSTNRALMGEHADIAVMLVDLATAGEQNYRMLRMRAMELAPNRRMAADEFDATHKPWRDAHTDFGLYVCDYLGTVITRGEGWEDQASTQLGRALERYAVLRDSDPRLPPMPSIVPAMMQAGKLKSKEIH